ncbi:hypothetical protein DZF79_02985 [Vibrio parahaemolyticus]|nr:hypothetical protein [Vibrio parahaemolyticus]
MTKRLVIIDKHYIKQAIKHFIAPVTKDSFDFIYTANYGFTRFTLEKISFEEVPYTGLTQKKHHEHLEVPKFNMISCADGKSINVTYGEKGVEPQIKSALDYINSVIESYDEVVLFGEDDGEGCWGFKTTLDDGQGCWGFKTTLGYLNIPETTKISFTRLGSLSERATIKAWESRVPWDNSEFKLKHVEGQRVKKYFDYWWNTNSSLVFSEAMNHVGLKCDPVLTKYELMTMMLLSRHDKPVGAEVLLADMSAWKGTGKYDGVTRIGSVVSSNQIIKQLVSRGFANDIGKLTLVISDEGRKFLSMLHPKTFDPDLGYRIANWKETRDIESVKRYIRTVFGKQLRFQRKQMGKGHFLAD